MKTAKNSDLKPSIESASTAKETPPPDCSKTAMASQLSNDHDRIDFPVVSIGASAGGLEALKEFFQVMPADSGMAFVIVVHLSPDHVSLLPDLLQKTTSMSVLQVTDNLKVEPNRVYVIPPNQRMAILNGKLQLLEIVRSGTNPLAIDQFLQTLSQDQADNAVCIILSGTGTDGTLGLRMIKDRGGMVMVQEANSARYDGMPQSAIATGLVDFILPPALMPQQLLTYGQQKTRNPVSKLPVQADHVLLALQKIYVLLRAKTGHDFSSYKKNTICRRIERRMHFHQIDEIEDYVRYLQESKNEITILFKDLLIGVTRFFRDSEAFDLLRDKYLPVLLLNKPDDATFRAWVPGCSSGEEAYSLAIILHECMQLSQRYFNVQIFATDIDEQAIDFARAGLFSESSVVNIKKERLSKYFSKEDSHYRIKKSIRETLIFATQNVIKDPPFINLDLLCCRNLLIYFETKLQRKLLPIFHYSLKPEGILFLGTSETIGQATDLFQLEERKWKIFKRKPATALQLGVPDLMPPQPIEHPHKKNTITPTEKIDNMDTLSLVESLLSQSQLPPCVIIDDQADILYVHGRIGRYLETPEGKTSINVLEMARSDLKTALKTAIRKTKTERRETIIKNLQLKKEGVPVKLNLIVRRLPEHQTGQSGLMLVTFAEVTAADSRMSDKPKRQSHSNKGQELIKLEEELQFTKESLQSTIEELETSNEEQKSSNEELQSTNEELQSTNEELETSREELQSLNEESVTVNSELQTRIEDLSSANDDIKNLLAAIEVATIFLDMKLCIRRFTPAVTELIPLTATDIDRPLVDLASKIKDVDLVSLSQKVLEDLAMRELVVESLSGCFYQMRMRPYRTINNVIDGVVITFEDITQLKKLYQGAQQLAAVVKDSNDAITLLKPDGKIIAWNKGAENLYGYSETEALQMNVTRLLPEDDPDWLKNLLNESFSEKNKPCIMQRLAKDARIVSVWLTVTLIRDKNGQIEYIATTERDLSQLSGAALSNLMRGFDEEKGDNSNR
ncbi:MAG: chemotaxis protein CheB [Desulfuromusa sp.]|nr:chemotaxis protein CheB [Desulfuromusa sp.]